MEYKQNIVTSWSITCLWVFLSLGLSLLTIYSFLQADWIIKRNLIVTNYYQLKNGSRLVEHIGKLSNPLNMKIKSKVLTTTTFKPIHFQPPPPDKSKSKLLLKTMRKTSEEEEEEGDLELLADEEYIMYNNNSNNNGSNYMMEITKNNLTMLKNLQSPFNLKSLLQSEQKEEQRELIKSTKTVYSIRLGTLGICASNPRLKRSDKVKFQCQLYGEDHVHSVSALWPMVTVIGGSGCVTLCVSAVLSTLAVALPTSYLRFQVATTIGQAQTVAVGLLFLSLIIFPMGFGSDFVRYHCGFSANIYNIGDCEIGWAYALVLVCTSLALYCPILVKFTYDINYDMLPNYI